ncbi:MAG TPA: hypothetical protein VF765_27135 [Polyangiaceae bacterium]
MEHVLWSAARRLLVLVVIASASVAVPFALDGRMRTLPAVMGAFALALLGAALIPMLRARRFLRQADTPEPPPSAAMAYRTSARTIADESTANRAARAAAIAFLLLCLAASLTIVAAAAR